jgi:hypothetical protein
MSSGKRPRPNLSSSLHRLTSGAPHRVSRDAQLPRDCLRTPPAIRQLANRRDDLSLDHRYLRRRRYQISSLELHSTSSRGVRISGARGSISLSLYTSLGRSTGDVGVSRICCVRRLRQRTNPIVSNIATVPGPASGTGVDRVAACNSARLNSMPSPSTTISQGQQSDVPNG